ncbi:hypothetical protein C7212DRAFT_354543 [Tuber magnatum]|uniref:Elongator complex protein 6 n=1 Tax=Tuber magnatum TaxID=42249 RepID=A0A317SHM7_9PEZI|nr:hypothetical protein C7212DRAFT_354543 [Tuber magnatum]
MPPPSVLTAYLRYPNPKHTLTLLTTLLSSPSPWLTQTLLKAQIEDNPKSPILFLSLIHERGFHTDGLRKLGVPLQHLDRSGKFTFLGIEDLPLMVGAVSEVVMGAMREICTGGDRDGDGDGRGGLLVVLEGLDILLQTGAGFARVMDMVVCVMEMAERTIVSVNIDEALMRDEEHAAFVIGLGHVARRVFGLRGLETGVARDVSGVLRITAGGTGEGDIDGGKEVLYFVGDGGGVEVFERGEVRGG